jgi:hypothetical protein|uniref:Uncharacterized protein n=1 Tax=Leptospirillum ferriphilum TaxID=178606 RepID=A0A2I2MJ30_9BACT
MQRIKKSADFAVSAFGQRNPVPGVCLGQTFLFQFQRLDRTSIQADFSGTKPVEMLRCDDSLDLHKIGPGNFVAWMENPLGQVPVVRQEENSLRLDIQSADMDQGIDPWEKVLESRFSIRIMQRRHDPFRFVEKKKEGFRLDGNVFSVDGDPVCFRMNLCSGDRYDDAVDFHQPSPDHFFRISA